MILINLAKKIQIGCLLDGYLFAGALYPQPNWVDVATFQKGVRAISTSLNLIALFIHTSTHCVYLLGPHQAKHISTNTIEMQDVEKLEVESSASISTQPNIPVPKSYVFFVWVKFNSVEKTELAIAFRSPTMLHLYDVVVFFFCIQAVDN